MAESRPCYHRWSPEDEENLIKYVAQHPNVIEDLQGKEESIIKEEVLSCLTNERSLTAIVGKIKSIKRKRDDQSLTPIESPTLIKDFQDFKQEGLYDLYIVFIEVSI